MIEFKGNIAVERSPEDVFAFVADPANRPRYSDNSIGSRTVTGGPGRAGSTFEESQKLGPFKLHTTGEVLACETPRRFLFTARNSLLHYQGEFAVEDAPGGARLT